MSSKKQKTLIWCREYNIWFYALFGTAVGAGTLFLPIQLGLSGPLSILIMLLIAFPFTYYPHLGLARYILKSKSESPNIFSATKQYYGTKFANIINFLYLLTFLLIICIYAITITNSLASLLLDFWQITISRPLLAFFVVLGLHMLFLFGEKITLKIMGALIIPLIIYLVAISFILIARLDLSKVTVVVKKIDIDLTSLMDLWLLLPVMVFSFSHTPIISTFASHCKRKYNDNADNVIKSIMKPSYIIICSVTLLFVISCVFSLSQEEILITKESNTTILTAIGNKINLTWIALTATPVAIIAMAKSFLGTYFGALEGVKSILESINHNYLGIKIKKSTLKYSGVFLIFIVVLLSSICNPNALNVISVITGPLIALILFILPAISVYLIKDLSIYKSVPNLMVLLIGIASFGIAIFLIF